MKIAYLAGPRKIATREIDLPKLTTGTCLVKIAACAICGSEKEVWEKGFHADFPNDPDCAWFGHEATGTIEEVGPAVSDWKVGDRVALYNIVGCGTCRWCRDGIETYCGTSQTVGQGFREHAVVPAAGLLPLPREVPFEIGTLLTDTLGTALRAIRQAGPIQGETVCVWGLGPIGLLIAQAAKHFGAKRVFAVEPVASRLELAREFGVNEMLAPDQALGQRLKDLAEGGPTVCFNTVANQGVCQSAYDGLMPGGRLVTIVAVPKAMDWFSERRVIGCAYFLRKEYAGNLELFHQGIFSVAKLLTHRFSLAEVDEAFRMRFARPADALKVVVEE
ncbi:MAG: alcohol dehydrogenase catalytic domain-containing protein [Verrucomicrobiae bacterium]|nr:alcohol dehydrogenase catalytic domain-containing protein [Verrucomicrobiae bacterium]